MSDFRIGERVLLPCWRLGYLVHIEPDGRKVFKDEDSNLVCEHGERASTNWDVATSQLAHGVWGKVNWDVATSH